MANTMKSIIVTAFLIVGVAVPVFGRSVPQERVDFVVQVPFELAHAEVVLSPGKFILYQPNSDDPNLFALYRDDLRHAPIAWVTTTRTEYPTRDYPETTNIETSTDESDAGTLIIDGWSVPGEEGWQVVSVFVEQ